MNNQDDRGDFLQNKIRQWKKAGKFFAYLFILAFLWMILSLIIGCSSSKGKKSTELDTLLTPRQTVMKAQDLQGLNVSEGDSTRLNDTWYKRISPELYLVTDTAKVVTKTETRASRGKTKNYYNINSNNQVNSENKSTTKDKREIDNSIKFNSENTTKKNDTNSNNKKNDTDSNNGNTDSRWKFKVASFPWWILVAIAVAGYIIYRKFKLF